MRPPLRRLRMAGRKCKASSVGTRAFKSTTAKCSQRLISLKAPKTPMPAQSTSTSQYQPCSASADSMRPAALLARRSSERQPASVPLASTCLAKSSSASCERATNSSGMRSRAATRAISRPMPDDAPVTTMAGVRRASDLCVTGFMKPAISKRRNYRWA